MKTTIQANDTVYLVRLSSKKEVKIGEMKTLYVGDRAVFIKGIDPVYDYDVETIFDLSTVNFIDPSKVLESNFYSCWADSLEKAEEMKSTIEKVIDFKNSFKTSLAS